MASISLMASPRRISRITPAIFQPFSLASAPVAVEIFKDEARHQRDVRDAIRLSRYRVGDTDLALIKRMSQDLTLAGGEMETLREGYTAKTQVERIYLSGIYRDKYNYITRRAEGDPTAIAAAAAAAAATTAAATYTLPGTATPGPKTPSIHHPMTPYRGPGMGVPNGRSTARKIRSAYPVVRLS